LIAPDKALLCQRIRAPSEALTQTEVATTLAAPPDPKVSATPSSSRFALTLDGICVSYPIESDIRNGLF
jgi:hypothetical protein